ncbi:three-Cys-motif partner protein TcmP [Calditrichota bacterium GD2]
MPRIDLHKKPFTEETITKLEIFEKYLEAWLPVFIHSPNFSEVFICDFFAGQGTDINGIYGSPLRIMNIIEEYQIMIIRHNLKINLILNEYNKRKLEKLKIIVERKREELTRLKDHLLIEYHNQDFKRLFDLKKEELRETANLMILDQNGIKQVTEEIFLELDSFSTTDFMFFISSSYFKRFAKTFKELFPRFDIQKIKKANFTEIHRVILEEYKNLLPKNSKIKLYPFSIKKGPNIYGIIFGSKHPLAVDKFLGIAWNENKLNGQANFDIDEDLKKRQLDLFEKKLTKIEEFQTRLEKLILNSSTITNREIYDFTIENGHLPKHSVIVVRKLKKIGKIFYIGQPRINYSSCYKENKIVTFEVK